MTEVYQGVFSLVGTPRMHGLGSSWRDSWGTYPLGLCSCFIMIQDVLSGKQQHSHCSTRGALAGNETLVCLGESACTACTPSLLWGTNIACLGTDTTCLDWAPVPSALPPGCTLTLPVWKLTLPAWDWMPALLVLPVWVLTLSAWD